VLKKGLESNPDAIELWKEAISLETPENARILLY
jgi:hypothetical protein